MTNHFDASPIHKMTENLNNNTFYIKRDDLIPISFGGNKARKAVLFFEDLIKGKFDSIVTYGSSSSNHCRIIANIAAGKGIPCHIISPSGSNQSTANSKLVELFGSFVTLCPVSEVRITIERKLDELKIQGYNPYFIQGGGHGDIGTQAYVNAYQEILGYENSSGIHFDYIFHTSGTGTTQAGLVCGKLLNDDDREIVGISNARKNPYGRQVILDSINSYLMNLNNRQIATEKVKFIDDYILEGYGSYNNKVLQTIKEVLVHDGIPLDTSYTGKAFWGMKEYIKKNNITDKKILFIHTGGTPLFFDKLEDLKNEQ
ncbi:1-aminocyclopropane-1-carboxylate deaminase/D-cysteine desulfhydrase [Virgibacillus halodenitrificans]|uniref:1-aminocyclopropane-1-carboxylate deaminase/D-cysteine desulfhydrase n=1 Tax=Virgibacillus halodenitrificans TaxID=1482 RepID=UPI00045D324B|nr:pyridoxal-phosphate dependent enzyme [Virgibacillus halodenitrificans]CDQ31412.1 D-cysteine desulfhydrase [Virgibacillus halodenitrificans]